MSQHSNNRLFHWKLWLTGTQVCQKSLIWIKLIMICCCTIMPWSSSWLSVQIAFTCLKRFKIAAMAVNLDFGAKNFSNSKSPCHPNASHQVLTKSKLPFGSRCYLKIMKMAIWNQTILAVLSHNKLCCPQQTSAQTVLQAMWFEEFQDGCYGSHLGYLNGTNVAILNVHVTPMPPQNLGSI